MATFKAILLPPAMELLVAFGVGLNTNLLPAIAVKVALFRSGLLMRVRRPLLDDAKLYEPIGEDFQMFTLRLTRV